MITFVTCRWHGYTMRPLTRRVKNANVSVWHYDRLFRQRRLHGGTWVFTDHERLDAYELRLAAECARLLREGGARVLNDPARVKTRHNLLRALKAAGINDFVSYRADEEPRPSRFPVFIRNESDHKVPVSDLIGSQEALERELSRLVEAGQPLRGLLVIEQNCEEIRPGLWRKYASYRVGDAVFANHTVVEYDWLVKYGGGTRLLSDPAFDAIIAEEAAFVERNLHNDTVADAFRVSGIDFGRADFGLVGGRPQIYEINTNPTLGLATKGVNAVREKTLRLAAERVIEHVGGLDTPGAGSIAMRSPVLERPQRLPHVLTLSRKRP
ncbi:MAG: hypothetical protein AB7L41_15905 [Flavobacteriaceae bacterium]